MADFFGNIVPPDPIANLYPGGGPGGKGEGLLKFTNNILKLAILGAGIFAFFNVVIAGYMYLSSAGDPQKVGKAAEKIWQSMIGLLLVIGSLVMAAIFGQLFFGDWSAILSPTIYGPE